MWVEPPSRSTPTKTEPWTFRQWRTDQFALREHHAHAPVARIKSALTFEHQCLTSQHSARAIRPLSPQNLELYVTIIGCSLGNLSLWCIIPVVVTSVATCLYRL